MFSIFPRDEKFFDQLGHLMMEADRASRQLLILISSGDEPERQAARDLVRASKASAKHHMRDIIRSLCASFVTPFDREDIKAVADELYKIPKTCEKIASYLKAHSLTDHSDFLPQAEVMVRATEVLSALMHDLLGQGKRDRIPDRALVLDELEQEADDLRARLLADLYRNDRDLRDLLIRRDVYDMMESAVDHYRNVADIAVQIFLKNS